MTLLVRSTLLGTLTIIAIVAAVFIVKAAIALGTLVFVCLVAVYLFRLARTYARRLTARNDLTIYRA